MMDQAGASSGWGSNFVDRSKSKWFYMYMWLDMQEYSISAHMIWTETCCIPYIAKVILVEI